MTAPARGSGPRPALMAVEGAQIAPSTIDIQRGGGSSAAGRQGLAAGLPVAVAGSYRGRFGNDWS